MSLTHLTTVARQKGQGMRGSDRGWQVSVTESQAEPSRLRPDDAQMKLDNEFLKKAAAYFLRRVLKKNERIQWNSDVRDAAGICRLLGLARIGYNT